MIASAKAVSRGAPGETACLAFAPTGGFEQTGHQLYHGAQGGLAIQLTSSGKNAAASHGLEPPSLAIKPQKKKCLMNLSGKLSERNESPRPFMPGTTRQNVLSRANCGLPS
jgi:hypothetical protein